MSKEVDSGIIHTSPARGVFAVFREDTNDDYEHVRVLLWGTTRGGSVVPLILNRNEIVNAASLGDFSHIEIEGE